ncbi:MAG: hydantoinase/oxoprolinase family protein [Parvibaculaceae bacterium]
MDASERVISGADAGGTFTDFVALVEGSGELKVGKTLSTPADPAAAIAEAARRSGVGSEEIDLLVYGTTIATNTLLERKGAKVGLLATKGFRDLIETQRVTRPDHFDMHWQKTKPLVPRSLRLGVDERVLFDGSISKPLDERHLREQIERLVAADVEAIAVAYLFSFMNPVHERRTREIIHEIAPGMLVSLSSDVLPKWGEFQRTSTTVIDAHLKPLLHKYLQSLNERCRAIGIKRLQIMQSNGGAATALAAAEAPARLVKSGPAGGVIASSFVGKLTGQDHIIIADMGGTSFETGFIPHCAPAFSNREELEFGMPIALNMIDVRAIGAGGGSLARIDGAGILKVGPRSAGSNPGPACYGLGGTEPTITDANVVLGRMVKEFPLGGYLTLDTDLAWKALEPLAAKLGMSVPRVAQGIIAVAVNNMAQAMRLVSVDRGHDPRLATLVPYGGAGPLHACELARALQINRILVPRFPGAFSALGALISETRFDYRQTCWMVTSNVDFDRMNSVFRELEELATDDFRREGIKVAPKMSRTMELRYLGQNFELEVPAPNKTFDAEVFEGVVNQFHLEHERLYGYSIRNEVCEVLNFNLAARAPATVSELPKVARGKKATSIGEASVYLDDEEKQTQVSLYDRATFGAGTTVTGPAIIGQMDSTTLLPRGASAKVDDFGNLMIEM